MKIFISILLVFSISTCNYFQKEKEDNTIRNIGILSIISNSNTSTSGCSGSSGVVICIPKGIAE